MKKIWGLFLVTIALLQTYPSFGKEKLKIQAIVIENPTSPENGFIKQFLEITKLMGTLKSDIWLDIQFSTVSKKSIPPENTVLVNTDKDPNIIVDSFYTNLNKYCTNRPAGSNLFISNPVLEGQEEIYKEDINLFFKEIETRSFDLAMIQECIEFVEAASSINDSTRKIYLPDLIPDLSQMNLREYPKILPLAILRKDWNDISGLIQVGSDPKEFLIDLNIDPFSNYHAAEDIIKPGVNSQSIMDFVKNPRELNVNLVVFAAHIKQADWWTIPPLDYKKPVTERLEIPGYFIGISAIRTVESFLNH